ncbi:MAG: hypothetical protein K2K83_06610 [Rikenella sp.]|nr:hypothetical protein [Rikenella sp.]
MGDRPKEEREGYDLLGWLRIGKAVGDSLSSPAGYNKVGRYRGSALIYNRIRY